MNRRRIGLAMLASGAGAAGRRWLRAQPTGRETVSFDDLAISPQGPVSSTAAARTEDSANLANPRRSPVTDEAEPQASLTDATFAGVADVAASLPSSTVPLSTLPPVVPVPLSSQIDAAIAAQVAAPQAAAPHEPVGSSLAPLPEPVIPGAVIPEAIMPEPVIPEPVTPEAAIPEPMITAVEPSEPGGNRWRIFGGVMAALLVAAAIAGSVIRLPYYSFQPGSVYDTIERVEAPPEFTFIPDGEIGFVTVAQTADISPWQWLDAKLDRSIRIRHRDEVRGDQTAQELREADLRRMQVSKDAAVVLALNKLGFDLIITPIGVEVAQVFECTAADGTLGTGDLIVGVNGVDVRSGEDLVAQLQEIGIGQPIEMLVERIDPNNPTQSMRTDLVGLTLGSADDQCLPDDVRAEEARPFIGIGTLPIFEEELPIDVEVRTGRVGGPSAGLAFTLAIMDVMSEGELTNGISVVATGTIDREGNVGPVGGIQQKVIAAERSGADIFLVPLCCDNFVDRATGDPVDLPTNYEEALLYAEDIKVVGVNTLDEALAAIGELGGDVNKFLE